jgi:hypothetical protein
MTMIRPGPQARSVRAIARLCGSPAPAVEWIPEPPRRTIEVTDKWAGDASTPRPVAPRGLALGAARTVDRTADARRLEAIALSGHTTERRA